MLELTAPFNEKGKVTHTLKLQRKLKFCSTSCTTEETEKKRKENILGDLRGKPQQGPFSLNSLTNSQKKVALQPRANYASCAERCCELKARSAALCVASPPRTWSYSWRKKSRALRQPAQQQLAQTEFCPSLRAIKTSLFGKSGQRCQKLLNGCRREVSSFYDMHHNFGKKLYDFAKN